MGPEFIFSGTRTKQSFSGPIQTGASGGKALAASGVPEGYLEPTLHLDKWSARILTANVAALQALGFSSEADAARRTLFDLSEGLTRRTGAWPPPGSPSRSTTRSGSGEWPPFSPSAVGSWSLVQRALHWAPEVCPCLILL